MASHVFVVGSGRSGTSLLRRLLDLDPGVAIAPESHFLDQWLPRFWSGTGANLPALWQAYRTSPHFTSLGLAPDAVESLGSAGSPRELFAGMLDCYRDAHGATVTGEKTAAHFRSIATLLEWFPDCRVAFTVRDPRAVVGSLKLLDVSWAQGPNAAHVALWRDAARAAIRWMDHPQVEIVRYEDLVADPVALLGRLHPLLTDRPFDERWLDEPDAHQISDLDNGSLGTSAPVRDDRRDSWRDRLRSGEAAVVASRCRPEAARLGYELDTHAGVVEWVRYGTGAFGRQAARVARVAQRPRSFVARVRYRRSPARTGSPTLMVPGRSTPQ